MSDAVAIGPTLFIIGCLIVGLPLLNQDTTAGRLLPCLACILLIARTIAWRVTETLPPLGTMIEVPGAALAALLIGIVESLASFSASAFKEVIVFMVIIPVLLWRSLAHVQIGEEE